MKSRNREINIFNMSLLDILCGALGAFCFLALTLFPYYGANKSSGGASAAQMQDLQKQLNEALEAASKGDTSGVVDNLRKQMQEYQSELQNETAAREKAEMEKELRSPVAIQITWTGADQDVDLFIKRPTDKHNEPSPIADKKQWPYIIGDHASDCQSPGCGEMWLLRDLPEGTLAEVYYKLVNLKNSPGGSSTVSGSCLHGENDFVALPHVTLNASRRLVMVGKLLMQANRKLTFQPAAGDQQAPSPQPGQADHGNELEQILKQREQKK